MKSDLAAIPSQTDPRFGRESIEEAVRDWLKMQMNVALASSDLGATVRAMREATKLHGMSEISRATGLDRVSLYRMLAEYGNPKLDTVIRILEAYGLRLLVEIPSNQPAPFKPPNA